MKEEEAQPPIAVTLVGGAEPIIDGRQFIDVFTRYGIFGGCASNKFWYREIDNYVVPPNCTAIIAGTAFTIRYERGAFAIKSYEDGDEHRVDLPTESHPRLTTGVTVTFSVQYPVNGSLATGSSHFYHFLTCGRFKNHYKGPAQFPVYAAYE